jgi:putative lipoprotein
MTMRVMVVAVLVMMVLVGCEEATVTEETLPATSLCDTPDSDTEVIESERVAMKLIPAEQSAVTGRVMYRQRIALPDNAIVKVQLQDVSLQDVAAKVISEQIIETNGKQVPFDFVLPYDPAEIDERNTYSISVRITVDGKLKFINETSHQVLTRGKPTDLDVTVEMVGR